MHLLLILTIFFSKTYTVPRLDTTYFNVDTPVVKFDSSRSIYFINQPYEETKKDTVPVQCMINERISDSTAIASIVSYDHHISMVFYVDAWEVREYRIGSGVHGVGFYNAIYDLQKIPFHLKYLRWDKKEELKNIQIAITSDWPKEFKNK